MRAVCLRQKNTMVGALGVEIILTKLFVISIVLMTITKKFYHNTKNRKLNKCHIL